MATRFKADDFTCPINAPEITQIIKMNMLVDCGWHILQCLFNALHPRCGAILPNFDPHADLASLSILPNETQGSFLLRCTDIYNKFCMLRGPVPEFRLLDKVVSLLYHIPALSAPLSILMNAVTHHKMEFGHENNEFIYSIEDVPMLLKGGCIPLSHNLHPVNTPTNIASKESLSLDFCHPTDDEDIDDTALIAAFKGRRPRLICEVCFKAHSVDFCPARGPKFIHEDALRRGEQYNLTHQEFVPKVPPRAPRPPPRDVPRSAPSSSRQPSQSSAPQDYYSRRRVPSKPSSVTSQHKGVINSFLQTYMKDDNSDPVSNKDLATISSLGSTYLDSFDPQHHPIHTLAALEQFLHHGPSPSPSEQADLSSFTANISAKLAPPSSPTVAYHTSSVPLLVDRNSLPSSPSAHQGVLDHVTHQARISALQSSLAQDLDGSFRYPLMSSNITYISASLNDDNSTDDVLDLDPFVPVISSNVARLPSPSLLQDDDDSSFGDNHDQATVSAPVKSDASAPTSLSSLRHLLNQSNDFFADDSDELLKVISMSVQMNLAPSNLFTLFQSKHISKNQLLNFLRIQIARTPSRGTSPLPGVDSSHPIDLTASPIVINLTDGVDDSSPTIAFAATGDLLREPSALLRESSTPLPGPADPAHLGLASPNLSRGFDGRRLRSYST